jgi:hypothetical protein
MKGREGEGKEGGREGKVKGRKGEGKGREGRTCMVGVSNMCACVCVPRSMNRDTLTPFRSHFDPYSNPESNNGSALHVTKMW